MDSRKILRIARWEVTKNAGGVDRRTVLLAVGVVVFLGFLGLIVAAGGGSLDSGIYRVGVSADSPYYGAVADDEKFVIRTDASRDELSTGHIEFVIHDGQIAVRQDEKGLAAISAFRTAIERYDHERFSEADNQTAAFPVQVELQYRSQTNNRQDYGFVDQSQNTKGTDGETDGNGGNTADGSSTAGSGNPSSDIGNELDSIGGGFDSQTSVVTSPADISPPFPFQSLILAFVFVIPLNFLIQAYGSSILSERLNRRGELLLVSPVTRLDIIAGKTMPYFVGGILVEGIIAIGLSFLVTGSSGGLVSVLAVTPLVLLFLAATFLGAMFARSFKELTFVTVTITVTLTSYAFVPAIFTNIGPLALISPLTIVVRDLQNEAISLGAIAFSVIPPTLTALTMFGLGAGLYREEDMFTQRPIPAKVLDALAGPIRHPWHVGLITAVLLPFVFLAELLAVALLFALGELSILLVLGFVAVIEELGKSLHIYAAHTHRRFGDGFRKAIILGGFSGVGFFLAEKIAVLAQVVGLPELAIGRAALQTGIVSGPLLVGFFLAPLGLHVLTATISATGAARSRLAYIGSLTIAITIHLAYNLAILDVIGNV